MHVSVEVRLALGVFEGEQRNGIVLFLYNFIILGCRAPLLTLAPLSYMSYMSCMTPYK